MREKGLGGFSVTELTERAGVGRQHISDFFLQRKMLYSAFKFKGVLTKLNIHLNEKQGYAFRTRSRRT